MRHKAVDSYYDIRTLYHNIASISMNFTQFSHLEADISDIVHISIQYFPENSFKG